MAKKIADIFIHFDRIHECETHRQTPHDGILLGCACIASRGKKPGFAGYQKLVFRLLLVIWFLASIKTGLQSLVRIQQA